MTQEAQELLIRPSLYEAEALGKEILGFFEDVIDIGVIGGSVRRQKPDVKDVEIVLKGRLMEGLFDDEAGESLQFLRAAELRNQGVFRDRPDKNGRPAFGQRYQRLIYRQVAVDIFVCLPPAQWGVILFLRTGSADFNKRIIRELPIGMHLTDGALYNGDELIPTLTEEDFFQAIHRPYVAPAERNS